MDQHSRRPGGGGGRSGVLGTGVDRDSRRVGGGLYLTLHCHPTWRISSFFT